MAKVAVTLMLAVTLVSVAGGGRYPSLPVHEVVAGGRDGGDRGAAQLP